MNQQFVVTAIAERLLGFLQKRDNRHAVIVGPPGSGKTSLLIHAAATLRATNAAVSFVAPSPNASVDELVVELAKALDVDSPAQPGNLRVVQGTLRVGPLLRRARAQEGTRQPLFLLLDDVDQFAESTALTKLIDSLLVDGKTQLRIVVASRPGPVASRLQRHKLFETFEVSGLSVAEAARFVQARVGRSVPAQALSRIIAFANGNPLLLQLLTAEIARLGEEDVAAVLSSHEGTSATLDVVLSRALQAQARSSDARRVLGALAVMAPVTIGELTRALNLPAADVAEVVTDLANGGLITSTGGAHDFVHALIREQALRTYVLDDDVVPGRLTFGDEAAERDVLLPQHFVAPPDLHQIVAGAKTVVLGDRGAGKSAVFRSLADPETAASLAGSSARRANVVVAVSKDPSAFLQKFIAHDSGLSSADRFKALWLFFVSVLAARDVHLRVARARDGQRYARQACHLLRSVGWTDAVQGEGRLRQLWSKVRIVLPRKVAFVAGPVTIAPEWSESDSRSGQRGAVEIGDFLKKTDSMLAACGLTLLVVIDQIDELFKYDRQKQEPMVQGLFLAEAHLSQTRAIRLVVLLRTDLFSVYDIQEKNKFVSRTVLLAWAWPALVRQMLQRIYANQPLADIAARLTTASVTETSDLHVRLLFPRDVDGSPVMEWLKESLKNGRGEIAPRQIVLFLNFLKSHAQEARRRVPVFSESEIRAAIRDASESAFQEVVSDFRVAVAFVRNCRAAKLTMFTLGEAEALIDPHEGTVAVQIELLERLGFLGREVTFDKGQAVARFRIPALFTRCWT